ncbi:hypothetical protein Tco_1352047 [Tanacetum coccineum]
MVKSCQALEKRNLTLVNPVNVLKFRNDDFIRRGHIPNAMPDPLLDVYQNYPSARELWKALEERFFTKDATTKFVALASCCKEAEWLRDLLINIPVWPKPMSPISVHCDSQSTLSRAYNQVYNSKSRHIGLRHGQLNQLINDGVITVSFLRSSKNLAGPFTKGLPRKLIENTSQGMGLKPIYGNNLDKVHLSECGSEAASYELKGLALKHYEKPRYRPKASFNGSAQSGLNEREEGYA